MPHMRNDGLVHPRSRAFPGSPSGLSLRCKRGQAILELALALPMLLVVLVGAAEFGRMAYYAIEVSNAARAGVAYGAQNHATASDIAGMQTAATNDIPNLPTTTATATNSCTCSPAFSATVACTATFACPAPTRIVEYVTVITNATVTPMFGFPWLPNPYALAGTATMRVEQ